MFYSRVSGSCLLLEISFTMLRKVTKWFSEHFHGRETLVETIKPGELDKEETLVEEDGVKRHSVFLAPVQSEISEAGGEGQRKLFDWLVMKRKSQVRQFRACEDERHKMKSKVNPFVTEDTANITKNMTPQSLEVKKHRKLSVVFKGKLSKRKKGTEFNELFLPDKFSAAALPPLKEAVRDMERRMPLQGGIPLSPLPKDKRRLSDGQLTFGSFSHETQIVDADGEKANIYKSENHENKTKKRQGKKGKRERKKDEVETNLKAGMTSENFDKLLFRENESKPVGITTELPSTIRETRQLSNEILRRNVKQSKRERAPSTTERQQTHEASEREQNVCSSSSRGATCQATPSNKLIDTTQVSVNSIIVSHIPSSLVGPQLSTDVIGTDSGCSQQSSTVFYSKEELKLMDCILQKLH